MQATLLFIFGVAIGSFLNVIALRFNDGERVFFTKKIQGRSHCVSCKRTLTWYELIPLLSYLALRGRCRTCKTKLNPQYPLIELACGLLFAFLPTQLFMHLGGSAILRSEQGTALLVLVLSAWLFISLAALTLTAIDIRLRIIPDSINMFLGIMGLALLLTRLSLDETSAYSHFIGPSAEILGAPTNLFAGAGIAIGLALLLFGGIVFLTKGRGMGLGDVKLAVPIAIILSWPDALLAFIAAFILGSVVGVVQMARKKATMKAALPFGPFLIAGMYFVVFFGKEVVAWYFQLV